MIKQVNRAAVDQRQQHLIEIRLGHVREVVVDAVKAETLSWPFATKTITHHRLIVIRTEDARGIRPSCSISNHCIQ